MMKINIEVDFDCPSDIKKVISRLQKRRKKLLRSLGYDEVYFNGSKHNMDTLLPLMEGILATDLSSLYPTSTSQESFYVYVHCNPLVPLDVRNNIKHLLLASRFRLTYTPFYVGKGMGDRYLKLKRNDSHRKIRTSILKKGSDVVATKIAEDLMESEALQLESKLIDILGLSSLSKHGMLVNLDEGSCARQRRRLYPPHSYLKKFLNRNGFDVSSSNTPKPFRHKKHT